jgi:hypothetical protein
MWMEKAAETALLLPPNSVTKGKRKTEKNCRGPMEIAQLAKTVQAMIQP